MKKKLIIGAIVLILLAIGLVAGLFLLQQQQDLREKAAPASTVSILPPTKTVNQGEQFDLTVQLAPSTNVVTGIDLAVTFDSEKLDLIELKEGAGLTVFIAPRINQQGGTASMTLGSQPANPIDATTTIATLKLRAKAPGQATVAFAPQTRASGIDEGGTSVIVSQNSSTVTVLAAGGATTTPSPALTTTPTQAQGAGTGSSGTGTGSGTGSGSTSPTPTTAPVGGGTGGTATPTTTQRPTATPTKKTSTSSATMSAQPVAGVSIPTMMAIFSGMLLLLIGVVLAL